MSLKGRPPTCICLCASVLSVMLGHSIFVFPLQKGTKPPVVKNLGLSLGPSFIKASATLYYISIIMLIPIFESWLLFQTASAKINLNRNFFG